MQRFKGGLGDGPKVKEYTIVSGFHFVRFYTQNRGCLLQNSVAIH